MCLFVCVRACVYVDGVPAPPCHDTYQRISDGVPHALDRAARAALAHKPLGEADVVERSHVIHGGVEVEERLCLCVCVYVCVFVCVCVLQPPS